MRSKREILAQKSSGNIFADLGLPNPEQELLKAQLTVQIYKIIKQRGLTQARAGAILGIKQPHVSALMRNRASPSAV
jgi:predicted XRE-type DNA-binding protein